LADQRVDDRDDAACIETARLVWTCGSAEIAAALLGLDPDQVRRAMNCVERVLGTPGRRTARRRRAGLMRRQMRRGGVRDIVRDIVRGIGPHARRRRDTKPDARVGRTR
jgi:hypothetical protein